jgi:hypothetical protein
MYNVYTHTRTRTRARAHTHTHTVFCDVLNYLWERFLDRKVLKSWADKNVIELHASVV